MKIHYDNIVFSLQQAGGISTYWSELISRLLRDQVELTFEEFQHNNIVRDTLPISQAQITRSAGKFLILERFKPVRFSAHDQRFVFHSSYNRIIHHPNAIQVTTVHDFVHEKFYNGIRRRLHLMQKNKVLRAADQIITVSEHTKRDLLEFHPQLSENNIKVVYNGVSEDFFPLDRQLLDQLTEYNTRPYLLYIGSRENYKNFNFTVELLHNTPDLDLYIVGSALTKVELQLLTRKLPGRWKQFANISNARLNELYNAAFALIYPSRYEGFGIPLLEAMKAGTPFLALNNSAIPEVAGGAGCLLEQADIGMFKEAIHKISVDRELMVRNGFKQAEKFSWEKCYQETSAIYKELFNQ
jgi:mannosyltransferase